MGETHCDLWKPAWRTKEWAKITEKTNKTTNTPVGLYVSVCTRKHLKWKQHVNRAKYIHARSAHGCQNHMLLADEFNKRFSGKNVSKQEKTEMDVKKKEIFFFDIKTILEWNNDICKQRMVYLYFVMWMKFDFDTSSPCVIWCFKIINKWRFSGFFVPNPFI